MPMKPLKAMTIDGRERGALAPCTVCTKEAHRRQEGTDRPHSSYNRRRPPTPADLDRLSRPKSVPTSEASNNCNWSNFIRRKSKYAIKSPNALCDLAYREENSETRPPFVNYGGRYDDKQYGQKRTFNSLAIHQMKHHEVDEQRLADLLRERRLRLQAENYFREMEARRARAQDLRDRAARSSTEYRDSYRPPHDYDVQDASNPKHPSR